VDITPTVVHHLNTLPIIQPRTTSVWDSDYDLDRRSFRVNFQNPRQQVTSLLALSSIPRPLTPPFDEERENSESVIRAATRTAMEEEAIQAAITASLVESNYQQQEQPEPLEPVVPYHWADHPRRESPPQFDLESATASSTTPTGRNEDAQQRGVVEPRTTLELDWSEGSRRGCLAATQRFQPAPPGSAGSCQCPCQCQYHWDGSVRMARSIGMHNTHSHSHETHSLSSHRNYYQNQKIKSNKNKNIKNPTYSSTPIPTPIPTPTPLQQRTPLRHPSDSTNINPPRLLLLQQEHSTTTLNQKELIISNSSLLQQRNKNQITFNNPTTPYSSPSVSLSSSTSSSNYLLPHSTVYHSPTAAIEPSCSPIRDHHGQSS
jgi:hypothetical protein